MAASSSATATSALAGFNSITILNLPDELLVEIIKLLSRRDQRPLQLVCHRFLHVARDPSLWRLIEVKPVCKTNWLPRKEKAFIDAVRRATMLRSLQCTNIVIQDTNALFTALASSCPLIEKFSVPHKTATKRNIQLLVEKCPNLTELYLSVPGPEDYDSIKQLKNLRSIQVRGSYWGYGIPGGQDILLKQLAKRCVHLEELHIDDAGVDADTLAFVATAMAQRLKGLTLKLSGSVGRHLSILDKFSVLQDLTLRFHPKVRYPCFPQCSRLKDLTRLKIECEDVDQAHLYDLFYNNKFEQLRVLKLKKARYFDDTILAIVFNQLANLEELHIDGSLFLDTEAIHYFLMYSPCLQVLKLSDLADAVTSACLAGIPEHCDSLTTLKVKLCDNISKEAIRSLASQKPGLSAMILDPSGASDGESRWYHYRY